MPEPTRQSAADYTPETVRWFWRERIPLHFLTVFAGRPGQGKSLLAAQLLAECTRRGWNAIYSSVENPRRQVTIPRLIAAGANLERVDLRRFMLPPDLEKLEAAIVRDNVRLVIIDPLPGHLVRVRRSSDSIRKVTTPLGDMAERRGCAIVILEHTVKKMDRNTHPMNWIMGGGSGLGAAVQMTFIVGRDPEDDDRVLLCPAKSNLRESPLALAFTIDQAETPVGEIARLTPGVEETFDVKKLAQTGDGVTGNAPPTKMAAANEWLTNYLKLAPNYTALAKDIREDATQYGHTKKTLDRAALDMGIVKNPPAGGKNTVWTLPQEVIDGLEDDDDDDDGNPAI